MAGSRIGYVIIDSNSYFIATVKAGKGYKIHQKLCGYYPFYSCIYDIRRLFFSDHCRYGVSKVYICGPDEIKDLVYNELFGCVKSKANVINISSVMEEGFQLAVKATTIEPAIANFEDIMNKGPDDIKPYEYDSSAVECYYDKLANALEQVTQQHTVFRRIFGTGE